MVILLDFFRKNLKSFEVIIDDHEDIITIFYILINLNAYLRHQVFIENLKLVVISLGLLFLLEFYLNYIYNYYRKDDIV